MRRLFESIVLSSFLTLAQGACTTTHMSPQEGTETGNPPVIDQALVALVVTADQVRIVGRAGAVRPGGSTVQIVSALTGKTFESASRPDGSFDVLLDGSPLDTFAVRARKDAESSNTVFVVQGGAAVGTDDAQQLSCQQRQDLAAAQMNAVADGAHRRCRIDSDCTATSQATVCSESCATPFVSRVSGEPQLSEARAAIESGLCSDFAADGCSVLRLPCAPSSEVPSCVNERCEGKKVDSDPSPTQSSACSAPFDTGQGLAYFPVYWYYPAGRVCLPRVYGGLGGNDNRYDTRAQCEASCLPQVTTECPPNSVEREVCVAGGIAGGCSETARACAQVCGAVDECKDNEIGSWCHDGACDAFSPL